MKVKYFAWVRERIGKAEETVEPPATVRTVEELIAWLSNRGEAYAYAFEKPKVIRAAIDHAHVRTDATIAGADFGEFRCGRRAFGRRLAAFGHQDLVQRAAASSSWPRASIQLVPLALSSRFQNGALAFR